MEITVGQDIDLITSLQKDWTNSATEDDAEQYISKLFPNTEVSDLYNIYFHFPRGSYVGVRQDTLVRYSIDTYSDDIYCCLGDFMSVLQRIGDLDIQYCTCLARYAYKSN